ncbi:PREDICTED: protein ECERIFERUM 1-like [Nelumbo nucifera]|uniref:Protein ECERIFERUM 2 n=2 Tax=Nelumbo nucifera TaxID=4432 RepID=A0A822XR36_NELNU|nr:PREDICTED: protein ECERIFERUM 1-like [Nelumbo nucifera]DAD22133.1 TPA_asm: hypothetical protein HUJ06_023596 [Nelumbo nucifera]
MAPAEVEDPVYDIKLSSVVPASITGEDRVHEFSSMDLALKLHYLRGLYFFKSNMVQGLTIYDYKKHLFKWLEINGVLSGRIRRSESGRPSIKCNDGGVRVIEAQCSNTLDQWLEMNDYSLHRRLFPNQVLGPDLGFSPLILVQFTWFKCGGVSVGLSWAHVLGDPFSASRLINIWAQMLSDRLPPKSFNLPKAEPKPQMPETPVHDGSEPVSVKQVEPVGEHWLVANNCQMETFSFQLTSAELTNLHSKMRNQTGKTPTFESLSAIIWQSLARVRGKPEPRTVTVYRKGRHDGELGNNQAVSVVKADFSIADASASELAQMLVGRSVEENSKIEKAVERDQGLTDFIALGVNLTFVNLEEVELYGLEFRGQKPIYANCLIDGVGDEGVVLVLPGPESGSIAEGRGGRTVTVTLPENQVAQLKNELQREWCISV